MASVFKGVELQKVNGTKTQGEVALKDKIVAVFFSAHWSRPCREFTSVLKDFYDDLKKNNLPFEVVFISYDRAGEDMKAGMEELHGDWYVSESHGNWNLPDGQKKRDEISAKWEVIGVPTLVILKADGKVINSNAVQEVEEMGDKTPTQVFEQWKKA